MTLGKAERYWRWNDALAAHFFNPEMAGSSVYLYVNERLVSEIEQDLPSDTGTFIDAVRQGPFWYLSSGVCQSARRVFRHWRSTGREFPPYIAYLSLFVLASGSEGDFAPNAYYPRLRSLLNESEGRGFPSFDLMDQLWEDLELWSVVDKQGELGLFWSRTVGAHVHVGYPISQTLLTDQERRELPGVFADSSLDPTSIPSRDRLGRALRNHGTRYLRPRTLRLLRSRSDDEFVSALLSVVSEELALWDGYPPVSAVTNQVPLATIRLCIELDQVSRTARATMRFKINWEFPEDGLLLSGLGLPGLIKVEEDIDGWSFPFEDEMTGELVDAAKLDWSIDYQMIGCSNELRLQLPGTSVRLFVDAQSEGLPGLVEVHSLPQGRPFYLVYSLAAWPELEVWTQQSCSGFQELGINGLPPQWKIARVDEVDSDEGIRQAFPSLQFPASRIQLKFVGGIRSSRRNEFFDFAPPRIIVEGGSSDHHLYCDDELLDTADTTGMYSLPSNLSSETQIILSVKKDGIPVTNQSLYLTGDFGLRFLDSARYVDRTGSPVAGNDSVDQLAAGAMMVPEPGPEELSLEEIQEDLSAELGNKTGYLVGQVPGQIVAWPTDGWAQRWRPIWAITVTKRKGTVLYVGSDLEKPEPSRTNNSDPRNVKLWKEVLWHWRKRINPPQFPTLKSLWSQYQEVARGL